MIFRVIIFAALLFPIIGSLLLELGMWGQGINQYGSPNGATLAMLAFATVFLTTVLAIKKTGVLDDFGAGQSVMMAAPSTISFRCSIMLMPMAAYVLFGLGGIDTIVNATGAGEFRRDLGAGGPLGYLILKFYAPSTFSAMALALAATGRFTLVSTIGFTSLMLVALSFGYKSAIIMALLPTATLLFWSARKTTIAFLSMAAAALVILAYWFMKPDDQADMPILAAVAYRVFVLNAEGAWKIWDIYSSGGELPSYLNTLLPVLGDRIFSAITGITRNDPEGWVMSHFSLMATHLAGYKPEYLLATGHNNSAGAMAEGIVAGGLAGMLGFAVLGGALASALYRFIENRLKANDFAAASVAACYFIYCLISWIIGGGVVEILHISVLVGLTSSFIMLRWATSWKATLHADEAI